MADHDPHLAFIAAGLRHQAQIRQHIAALKRLAGPAALSDALDVFQAVALADDNHDAARALLDRCRDVPGDYLGGE